MNCPEGICYWLGGWLTICWGGSWLELNLIWLCPFATGVTEEFWLLLKLICPAWPEWLIWLFWLLKLMLDWEFTLTWDCGLLTTCCKTLCSWGGLKAACCWGLTVFETATCCWGAWICWGTCGACWICGSCWIWLDLKVVGCSTTCWLLLKLPWVLRGRWAFEVLTLLAWLIWEACWALKLTFEVLMPDVLMG